MKNVNYLLIAVLLLTAMTGFSQSRKSNTLKVPSEKITMQKENVSNAEASPFSSSGTHQMMDNSKATWDVEFSFNASAASNPGIETDGTNFYTVLWNGADFTRYDMDGLNPEIFQISGVTNIRDMAYDGTYFYGSDASMNLYQMDLANETLVSTITATCTGVTGIRHIAYDPNLDGGNGGFWIGNWTELGAIDMSGAELVASTVTLESCYGSAYDNWTDPANPCLWLFQQPGSTSDAIFYQFDINTYSMTGVTHDCASTPDFADGALAGGACTLEYNGKAILVGSIQQDPCLVVGYELAVLADPSAPDAVTDLTATPDASGALTADISWTNPALDFSGNALAELTLIELFINEDAGASYSNSSPVIDGADAYTATVATAGFHTFTVVGTNTAGEGIPNSVTAYVGEDVPAAPSDVILTATDMDASVTWTAPTEGLNGAYFSGTGITYDVYRNPGAVLVSEDQTATTFNETLTSAGNYNYEIVASNSIGEGGSSMSNNLIIGDFLLYEDFETGATEWTQEAEGDGVWTFQAGGASGNPATAYEGDNNAFHGHVTSGNTTKLISPEVLVSSNDFYELKFWMAQVNWAGDQDQLKVYFKSGASGEWVELASYEEEVVDWTEETLIFYSAEAPYIAFEGIDGYGYGNCVDFVTVVESSTTCIAPIELGATTTQTTAQLSWVDETGDTWNIEWGETEFTLGEGTLIEGTTDNPYTLEGLDAGTFYDFYVQTDCGVDGTSTWAGPFTFSTSCEAITSLPYVEDFESGIACWTIEGINANETWYLDESGTSAYEGSANIACDYDAALGDQDEYIISNEFDLSGVTGPIHASFYWKASYNWAITEDNYNLSFEVSTDGGTVWNPLWDLTDVGVFTDFNDTLQIVDLSTYAGEASVHFAFHYVGNDGAAAYVDLFEVDFGTNVSVENNSNIAVYPNPANNVVTIENAENAQITIVNMVGQVVASQVANSKRESINISDLSNGTYVIRIENGNEVSTQKLNVIR